MSDSKPKLGWFCWAELQTSDAAGARDFYTQLMGWVAHDDPIPGGGTYTMLRLGDINVGALFELNDEMKAGGAVPNWMPYVKVDSAVDAAAKAKANGANVIVDAMDVLDIGAMAVLMDPGGAVFSLWQEKIHHGFDVTDGRVGTVCWTELMTKDVDQAGAFYADTFGWSGESTDAGGTPYYLFKLGDREVAGMMGMHGPEFDQVPPHWITYFAVANTDETVDKATGLGATLIVPATDIPGIGRFSVLSDPQGAVFSVIAMPTDN